MEAVLWGIELEPVLAQVYAKRTGFRVRRVNAVLQHPEQPFMLANLDREVVGHPDGPGILEIKTASYHSAPQWEEGVPVAYQCQVLHQLAVTGHAWAEVAVLIGGQDFRIYRIERDEEKLQDLTEREAQFWQMVQQDQQPEPDGSSDAANALSWLFPRDDGQTVDLSDSPEFNQLFGSYCACVSKRKLSSNKSHNSNSGCKRPWVKRQPGCLPMARSPGSAAKTDWHRISKSSGKIIPTCSPVTSNRCPACAVSPFNP